MRHPRRKIRRKRFLFPKKKNLPLFYSQPRKTLTLAYDYEDDIRNETDYLERIEVAIKQFNSLGLVDFVYQPLKETNVTVIRNCPVNEIALKEKHLNQIVFGKMENPTVKMLGYSAMIHPLNSYFTYLNSFSNETVASISNFGGLGCNLAHPAYQELSIGVLVHELGHILGITDLINYNPQQTQGILSYNLTQNALADFYQACIEKEYNRTDINCVKASLLYTAQQDTGSYSYTIPFTPVSLFSLYQYRSNILKPFVLLHKTRIQEILADYGFSETDQDTYFSLLNAYQGRDQLLTYQDLLALAYTVYGVAPDTLVKRRIYLPYVRFIEGMYRPPEQEQQLANLIQMFVRVENFTYPILSQKTVTFSVTSGTFWQEDLIDLLKLVSLNNSPLDCSLESPQPLCSRLDLNKNCLLSGMIDQVGMFHFNITVKDQYTHTKNILKIESLPGYNLPRYGITHHIFIGKPVVLLQANQTHIDNLVATCFAAAYPHLYDLKCAVMTPHLQPYLKQCALTLPEQEAWTEIKIKIFNDRTHKFCTLKYPSFQDMTLNHTNLSLVESFSGQRYKRSAAPLNDRYLGVVSMMSAFDYFLLYSKQFNYLFTLPLLQGVFEGMVDESHLSAGVRSILKLLPRLSLIGLSVWSEFQRPIFLFYALFEANFAEFLDKKMHPTLKNFIVGLFFMLLTEFEYGCSNLWERAGSPRFWSGHSEQFNQLFIQALWVPIIKIMGYLTTIAVTESCRCITEDVTEVSSEEEGHLESNVAITTESSEPILLPRNKLLAANTPFFGKAANSEIFQNQSGAVLSTLMMQGK